jgi:hypothetical protein
MLPRRTILVTLGIVAALSLAAPAWADHNTDHTIEQMTAHYQDPGLEVQNKPFALLYLRTTEGMRDTNNAGEFSDPAFWDTRVIPTFATYYLDAYAAWKRGDTREVDPAWRIAFRANAEKLTCTQLLYLGINAHVNNDLAFMIEEMGARYTYPDHKHVDDVLAFRTQPVVYPEIQRELCQGCSPRRSHPAPTPTSSPGGSWPGTTPSGSWPPPPTRLAIGLPGRSAGTPRTRPMRSFTGTARAMDPPPTARSCGSVSLCSSRRDVAVLLLLSGGRSRA